MHYMTDSVTLSGTRKTEDGFLVAEARVARTGIQVYQGKDFGRDDLGEIRVYRPEEEVFAKDALHGFAHRPVTVGHPAEMVDADNWKEHAVGQTGDEVARDGEFVRVPMVIMDAAAIKSVEAGTRELSMGYALDLEFKDGIAPNGEPYDAIQRNLRMNHLAIVANARGGSELKIGDGNRKETTMADPIKTRTVLVDGLSVECTDQSAQAIEKLQGDLTATKTALTDAETKHKTELAAKDAELGKKDGEIDDLKSKVLDGKALDARVAERATLVDAAGKIAKEVATDGLSDADIRKAVVVAKLGDAAIEGKSDEYISARFDGLADAAPKSSSSSSTQIQSRAADADGDPWAKFNKKEA